MTTILLAISNACLLTYIMAANSGWNQGTRDYILDIHNDYRRNEGGCEINKLEYDLGLENEARRLAERCTFGRGNKGFGENVANSVEKLQEKDLIKHSLKDWFDGKATCDSRLNHDGRRCSKYKQMVWGNTEAVGCYSTRCSNLAKARPDAWYLVCLYDPKGDSRLRPYRNRCSNPCQAGQTVDQGLCVGQPPCKDEKRLCKMYVRENQCRFKHMEKECTKSCSYCDRKSRWVWKNVIKTRSSEKDDFNEKKRKSTTGVLTRVENKDTAAGVSTTEKNKNDTVGVLTRKENKNDTAEVLTRLENRNATSGVLTREENSNLTEGVLTREENRNITTDVAKINKRNNGTMGVLKDEKNSNTRCRSEKTNVVACVVATIALTASATFVTLH